MQKLIAICLIAVSVLSACEKRKGSLLPPRQPRAEGGGTEMRARTAPPELMPEAQETAPQEFDEAEKDSLQRVKQEALKRARQAPSEVDEEVADSPKAAKLYERGRGLMAKGQSGEGMEYFLAACQLGYVEACHKFAWHEERIGNPANAFRFYRIACEYGLNKSCNNIGFQLEKQRKWDDALDYYARACLNQHSIGCDNLKRLRSERLQMH